MLHARRLFTAGWTLLAPHTVTVPIWGGFEIVLEKGAAHFAEKSQPPRYASPYPELRGAALLQFVIRF